MTRAVDAWERFWFKPEPTSTLAVIRIAFGLLCLGWAVSLAPDLSTFFSTSGIVPDAPRFGGFTAGAWSVLGVEPGTPALLGLYSALLLSSLMVIVGLWTRPAAAVVFVAVLSFQRRDPYVFNGGDQLIRILAFYLMLAPAGASVSLDRWLRHRNCFWESPRRAPWVLRLLQVQLSVIYGFSVWTKLRGTSAAGPATGSIAPQPPVSIDPCQLSPGLCQPQPPALIDPCQLQPALCAPQTPPLYPPPSERPVPIDPCTLLLPCPSPIPTPIPCPLAGSASLADSADICPPPPCPLLESASSTGLIADICPPPCPLPLAGASAYPIPLICPPPPPPPPCLLGSTTTGTGICPPPPCPLLDGGALAYPIIDICPPPEKLAVLVAGAGRVTSNDGQVDCPGDCLGTYPLGGGATVRLTETPGPGFSFEAWGGACAPAGSATDCALTMDASKFVSAVFEPVAPPPLPEGVRLVVAPGGNGAITSADGKIACGSPGPASDRAQQAVLRGRTGLAPKCVAPYQKGDHVELTATAQDGWEFTGWGGGVCSGTVATCSFAIEDHTLVKGDFRPEGESGPSVDVEEAAFVARWQESVVRGWLRLSGHASRGGVLVVRLARVGRGLAATGVGPVFRVRVRAGHFRAKLELPPGLLPGRYVVRVTSRRDGVSTRGVIELAAPREGVVSRAYLSATEGGPPVTGLSGAQPELWASFSFAARPGAGLPITISWFGPDGKLVAPPAQLSSAAAVSAFIRADGAGGLPKGTWKAVLTAGAKAVKTVSVSLS